MASAYNSITGSSPNGQWAALAAGAYDRAVDYQLRTMPIWRAFIDKHPVQQSMPGTTVTLNILNQFAANATTPLDEITDPDAVAPPAPTQKTVTLAEYGNYSIQTWRLRELGYTNPSMELANLIAKNLADSLDALVQAIADGGTHVMGTVGGTLRSENTTTAFATTAVTATDVLSSKIANAAVVQLRKRKSVPKDGVNYFAVAHPDVTLDLRSENAANAWVGPHAYGGDTEAIYAGEAGRFGGARYIEIPDRVTVNPTGGASSVPIYTTYFLGQQAIVEAVSPGGEPQVVIGDIVDPLRRKFPIGWKALLGWSIYRQESLQRVVTSSSAASL